MEKTTQDRINALEAIMQSATKEINELKNQLDNSKFEVGKWYKTKSGDKWLVNFTTIDDKIVNYYGFCWDGWRDKDYFITSKINEFEPATESEVFEALKKEAVRRGFKDGVTFRTLKGNTTFTFKEIWFNESARDLYRAWSSAGGIIFEHGKWAEIIKHESVKVGGYEVKFKLEGGVGNPTMTTRIDGNEFTKEFWQAAKLISEHSKAKIMVGCSKQFNVSLETINQILEKL